MGSYYIAGIENQEGEKSGWGLMWTASLVATDNPQSPEKRIDSSMGISATVQRFWGLS